MEQQLTKTQNLFISIMAISAFTTVFSYMIKDEPNNYPKEVINTDNYLSIGSNATFVAKPSPYIKVGASNNGFWSQLHEIESKRGKLKYQYDKKLGYKPTDCKITRTYCGHHQIGYQALKDIDCTSKQCLANRDDYDKSLAMAKKILAKKLKRYPVAENWQKYTLYQQGANGLKTAVQASNGKRKLSHKNLRAMARNSMFTYKELKNMSSKKAAKAFLHEWRSRWEEARQRIAGI